MAKPKGSKFWDSSSSSDSESTRGSDGEDVQPLHQGGKRFDDAFESDSESEDEARVVKSHKDKAWDTFKESIVKIRNAMKTHDWTVIHDDFELVNKQIEKSKMLIAKEGLPKFYIKMLGDVEDFVLVSLKDKEAIKKMKKNVALALNRMKLVTKKHNLKYKDEIADYRANPDKYQEEIVHEDSDEDEDDDDESDEGSDEESEESDEDSDESEEESDESEVPTKSKTQLTKKLDRDDSDDDSLFESEEEESSSSDESEEDGDRPELKGRAKWLKKAVDSGAVDKKEEKKLRKKLESRKTKEKDIPEAQIRKSAWKMEDNLTEEALDKKVNELVASRGKKGTDVRQLLRQLEMLAKASRKYGPNKEIPVLMHLMSFMFDSHRVIDDYLEIHRWRTCHRCLTRVVQLLEENQSIVLTLFTADDVMDLSIANKKEVDGEVVVVEKEKNKGGLLQVVGNIEAFVSRLDDEYMKSLQQINPHTKDYIIRLSDEAMLSELAESVHKYYTRIHDMKAAATVALLQVEHLYYKHDSIAAAVQHAHLYNKKWGKHSDLHPASIGRIDPTLTAGSGKKLNTSIFHPASYLGNPTITTPISNPGAKLDELCSFIYTYGDERHKTRALLCAVYHHALHDRYYQARDLFLISHIQDSIDKADTNTQILYNRALVTMGLAAFRLGLIQKAHDCLSTICSGRVRELLAQGQSRWAGHDRDPEQEKLERRRQMPYHMHINPELLDCCHLISAMLLELPHMVKNATGSTTIISRTFRKYLQAYNRQVFTGPPENTREHVMAAAKCMMTGDWARACGYIVSQEVWNLLPNDGGEAVKEMLRNKLREESLRIYLLSYSSHYESMSLQQICDMFVMDAVTARRIISRMIFQKEIYAAWDQPPDTLLIYKVDATPAQALSQQLADKLAQLVENNERILDTLGGSYNYKDDWSGRGGADQSNRPRSNWKSNWNSSGQQQQGGTSGRYSGGGGRTGGYQGRGGRGGGRGNAPGGGGTSNWGSGGGRGGAGRGGSQDRSGRTGSAYSSRQYQQRQQSFGTKVEGDLASKRGPTRN